MNENGKVELTHSGKPVIHGRASSYNNHHCRCKECRTAWAAYMKPRIKKYRAKKKQPAVQISI